jgi:hypothetical protein
MSSAITLGIEGAETVGHPVLASQNGKNARHLLRRILVEGADPRMSVRREDKDSLRLANEIDVRDVASQPRQKAAVFLARDRLSDTEAHPVPPFTSLRLQQVRGIVDSRRRTPLPSHRRKAGAHFRDRSRLSPGGVRRS